MEQLLKRAAEDLLSISILITVSIISVVVAFYIHKSNLDNNLVTIKMVEKGYEECSVEAIGTNNGNEYVYTKTVWAKNCNDMQRTVKEKISHFRNQKAEYMLNKEKVDFLEEALDNTDSIKDETERSLAISSILDKLEEIKTPTDYKPSKIEN